ncbi:MAG: TIGR03790 family protein [Opitutaceae bacterium]|nr:TIGR03790 family protein [Verrucomicrobiales bacterium]
MRNALKIVFAVLTLLAGALQAADSGASVVVVYNKLVPASKTVADHYAAKRKVPPSQVIGLGLPTGEVMTRAEFRDQLQRPLMKWLEKENLFTVRMEIVPGTNGMPGMVWNAVKEAKIRYAVLCYGVPVKIANDPGFKETGADKLSAEMKRNDAAVDSELALLPLLDMKPLAAGVVRNTFYLGTNAAAFHPTNGILMVARLDGPTSEIAQGLVDKAIQAETNGLWGRAYFDLRGLPEGAYKMGDDWLRVGAEAAKRAGFETVIDEKNETWGAAFPLSQVAIYAGWYDGGVSGPFAQPMVEFMPGAFAYHLHSFSATTIRTPTQHWVGPLLAKGVTITMGSVEEPYLAGTPDIGTFLSRFLLMKFSFGEAAYAASTSLSWQTTVVGDPLFRPYANGPQQQHEDLQKRQSSLIEWSHLKVVNLNLAQGFPETECVNYLEGIDETKKSAVLTEKLGDLYKQLGKPASALSMWQKALTLAPTPQARVRLNLKVTAAQAGDAAK